MSVHDTLARFGKVAADQVLALWHRWQAGEVTEAEFRALARAVLVRAGARSAALADLALATALRSAPVGLVPATGDPEEALTETLTSVSYERDPEAAVAVLGSAFALEAYQRTYGAGMTSRGVEYWRRVANPGACEVCIDLSEGIVSTDVPMWHHKGCGCVAEPITS